MIDPAPAEWQHGSLSVAETWWRLAIDIIHYHSRSSSSVQRDAQGLNDGDRGSAIGVYQYEVRDCLLPEQEQRVADTTPDDDK